MADQKKEIDRLCIIDDLQKPGLRDERVGFDDLGVVRVTCEIEEYTKGHDTQAMLCREVPKLFTNVLVLTCPLIEYLHVTGQVLVSIEFGEIGKSFICDVL